jgi:hypothetical protein
MNAVEQAIEKIGHNDQVNFVKFITALREDYENTERNCRPYPQHHCIEEGHWDSRTLRDFLRSVEDWGVRSDFGEGADRGEPVLRTVARMLYVGRFKVRDEQHDDRDEWDR